MDTIERVLRAHPAQFGLILENAADLRFQVVLSEVIEDNAGEPSLIRHGFRVDSEYFYPASAIKLCAAVASLLKLKHIKKTLDGASCASPLLFQSLVEEGDTEQQDTSNLNGQEVTIAHELRKLFLVSDNQAFNRLYDFVGHRSLNQAMWDANLPSTRIRHRLWEVPCNGVNDNICSPVEFKNANATFPPKWSQLELPENMVLQGLQVGNSYISPENILVNQPMDFSQKNCMSLLDLQNLLIKITRPDLQIDDVPLDLDKGHVMLLMEAMCQYAGDSCNPSYDRLDYPDDYCKFFLPGLCRVRSKGALRIYNKVGRAYGFTTDNAYVFDIETGRSFYLSATIYTNGNGILNDDVYEYHTVAHRAMCDLAEVLSRAIWKIPPTYRNLSTPFDCVPYTSSVSVQQAGSADEDDCVAISSTAAVEPSKIRFRYFIDE